METYIRAALLLWFVFITSLCNGQSSEEKLTISHVEGNFYIYTTYQYYKGNRIGANSMYLLTKEGAILFDTPWDTTQFQPLLDTIRKLHGQEVIMAFATHFHNDRTRGLEFYKKLGIKTFTTRMTDSLSAARGEIRGEFLMKADTTFNIGGYTFQSYYPGPGHTPDNIIFWFKKEKILYGACLIKSAEDDNLGNIGDADVERYAQTLVNVQKKCRDPKFIIVGHGNWRDKRSLEHSLNMARALRDSK